MVNFIIDKNRYLYLVKIVRLEARHIGSDEQSVCSIDSRYDSIFVQYCRNFPLPKIISFFDALFFLTCAFDMYDIYMILLFFTGCSCVVYSSSDRPQGGTFTSPDYPKRYPPNIDCLLYTFIGHPDEIVVLRFHHFNIRRIWPE